MFKVLIKDHYSQSRGHITTEGLDDGWSDLVQTSLGSGGVQPCAGSPVRCRRQ